MFHIFPLVEMHYYQIKWSWFSLNECHLLCFDLTRSLISLPRNIIEKIQLQTCSAVLVNIFLCLSGLDFTDFTPPSFWEALDASSQTGRVCVLLWLLSHVQQLQNICILLCQTACCLWHLKSFVIKPLRRKRSSQKSHCFIMYCTHPAYAKASSGGVWLLVRNLQARVCLLW